MNARWIISLLWVTLLVTACAQENKDTTTSTQPVVPLAEIEISEEERQAIHLEEVLAKFQAYVEVTMDTLNLPSVAYAIVKDGKVIQQYVKGSRRLGTQDSINENTIFRTASISKSFAAVLASVLVDKGLFDWEDSIKTLEPNFRLKSSSHAKKITVRHILSHTSGLRKYALSRTIQSGKSFREVFKALREASIEAQPGEIYAYQNAIYSVISNVVKRKTGYSYEKMLDSLIFKPLNMPTACTGYKGMMATENRASPHIKKSKTEWRPVDVRTKWYNVMPAAGVNASLADMTIWLKAMLGEYPDVISKQALADVFKPNIPMNEDSDYYENWAPGIAQASYAMGWRSFDFRGKQIIYHGGWVRGYRPEMGFCPKEGIGLVLLTNSNRNNLSTFCMPTFFKLYFEEENK